MLRYASFLAPLIEGFVRHAEASDHQNDASYGPNLLLFDRWCSREYPGADELTQEMADGWCRKRVTESNNSCRSRIYVVVTFVRYLRARGLTGVSDPDISRKEASTCVPHAFTHDELARFLGACDSLPVSLHHVESVSRSITVPVSFRLLYSSGMRTTEARMLRVADVDLAEGVVAVRRSKGHDEHVVALHPSIAELMAGTTPESASCTRAGPASSRPGATRSTGRPGCPGTSGWRGTPPTRAATPSPASSGITTR